MTGLGVQIWRVVRDADASTCEWSPSATPGPPRTCEQHSHALRVLRPLAVLARHAAAVAHVLRAAAVAGPRHRLRLVLPAGVLPVEVHAVEAKAVEEGDHGLDELGPGKAYGWDFGFEGLCKALITTNTMTEMTMWFCTGNTNAPRSMRHSRLPATWQPLHRMWVAGKRAQSHGCTYPAKGTCLCQCRFTIWARVIMIVHSHKIVHSRYRVSTQGVMHTWMQAPPVLVRCRRAEVVRVVPAAHRQHQLCGGCFGPDEVLQVCHLAA